MCFVIAFSPSVVGRAIDAAPGIERWDKCDGIPMDSLGLPPTSKTRRFEDLFYEDVIGV
jgi:hypothetical protein